ncbi:MAG: regulatory protein RecX [Cyclobacteriaceae bacterium]|nr:regulatory protein RecX [Cyclobacteriaceae bacterium]
MFEEKQPSKKIRLSPKEALVKIQHYCAYQERSHKEVKNKLFEYGLYASEVDEILAQVISDGFLNEERFAKAFAGGKFRIKKWGRLKIKQELEMLGLTSRCVASGLKEIDSRDYRKTLQELIQKKTSQISEENEFKRKNLIARFVIGKGYESELVWSILKSEEE